MNDAWEIRLIHSAEEMVQVEDLQRAVWPGNDAEIVPGHLLLTAAHNGGLVAGAFVEGKLVGFVFGFLGFHETPAGSRLKHCSHMLGVRSDRRSAGIGLALKRFQREFVLAQGLELITWTYDPLLARNARLNIAKLGATCRTYRPNLYGEMRDGLNAGLPSDRFQVEWWVQSERVASRLSGEVAALNPEDLIAAGARIINPLSAADPLQGMNPDRAAAQEHSTVLVEIPSDFSELKATHPAAASQWRVVTRKVFEILFSWHFVVVDFIWRSDPTPTTLYVLQREAYSVASRRP